MKYNEETFKKEVETLYNKEIEVIGKFKGVTKPILIRDKYGLLEVKTARQLLNNKPSIMSALNKTEYFMNQLRDLYPYIAEEIIPQSEYVNAKTKMLFETKFGIVSISPDALLSGHMPNIRSAINRKEYFKNQLLYLYDNKYDFIVNSTDRHDGRCILICPIHGEQPIDNDHIFSGCGCPKCNKFWENSNVFYLVRMFNDSEDFYKLGISYKTKDGNIRRFKDYKSLGYNIEEIKIIEFEDFMKCRDFETKLKRLIKNNLYTPLNWENKSSTECFTKDSLPIIINNLNMI